MRQNRSPPRLVVLRLSFCLLGMVGAEPVGAAPPALATEQLDSPHRKTLTEFDREFEGRAEATLPNARAEFLAGLSALDKHDYAGAQETFSRSNAILPSYAATFNVALIYQLKGDYSEAQERYIEAHNLHPQDAERQVNLGLVLLHLGDTENALLAFEKALTQEAPDPDGAAHRGRVLLQLGLAQNGIREQGMALESLQRADEAFAKVADERGRAVVAAKRGNILIKRGRQEEGARLLRDAVVRLEMLGARMDEASARTDLASYYLGPELWEETAANLARSVELAKQAGNPQQLARALNNLGNCRLNQGRLAEAREHFQSAIKHFRLSFDRLGEAESENNLGIVHLKQHDRDASFEHFDESVRLYRKAGAWQRAFDKSVQLGEEFSSRDELELAEYFLDIARSLDSPEIDSAKRGKLLLALGRHHLASDPRLAEGELREAKRILDGQQDSSKAAEAERLLAMARAGRQWQRIRIGAFVVAGLLLAVWAALVRGAIVATVSSGAQEIGSAIQFLRHKYEDLRNRWIGPEPDRSLEELSAARRLERCQRQIFWSSVIATILVVMAIDAAQLSIPHLRYVLASKATVETWPLPPSLGARLHQLMNWTMSYIAAHLVTQTVTLAIGLGVALLAYRVVEYAVFGGLRRVSRPFDRKLDPRFRIRYLEATLARQQRLAPLVLIVLVIAALLYFRLGGLRQNGVTYLGLLLVASVTVAELLRFLSIRRDVQNLAQAEQPAAFDWLHRSSRHRVVSLALNLLMFAYVVVPALYHGTRALQTWLIHPSFERTSSEFSNLLFEAVKKYGTIALEGDSALLFTRLENAYDPRAGAGQLWDDFLWPLLPFLFVAWTIMLFCRLVLPWATSLGGWRGFWNVAGISICVTLAGTVFKELSTSAFHLDSKSSLVWLGMIVVGLMFTLYLRQAVNSEAERNIECRNCHQRNPSTAAFCHQCGHKLDQGRDSEPRRNEPFER